MKMYQLWTHQLFPSTKFSDTVTKIETVCKKRVMSVRTFASEYFPASSLTILQSALSRWRLEAAGRGPKETLPEAATDVPRSASPTSDAELERIPSKPTETTSKSSTTGPSIPDKPTSSTSSAQRTAAPASAPVPNLDEDPGFDDADLDQLNQDAFDADEEAMREMEMDFDSEGNDAPAVGSSKAARPVAHSNPPQAPLSASDAASTDKAAQATAEDDFDDDFEMLDADALDEIERIEGTQAAATSSGLPVPPLDNNSTDKHAEAPQAVDSSQLGAVPTSANIDTDTAVKEASGNTPADTSDIAKGNQEPPVGQMDDDEAALWD